MTKCKKAILTKPGEWLDDNLINAAQVLLKRKFLAVGSLQSCTLAEKLAFDPQGEAAFVQILNIGGNHWITTSTIGCEAGSITIYDSLHWKLSNLTRKVLADLLMAKKKAITVIYSNVQFQFHYSLLDFIVPRSRSCYLAIRSATHAKPSSFLHCCWRDN